MSVQEEAHPSDDLLGAASAEAKRQAQALGQELGGAANDDDEGRFMQQTYVLKSEKQCMWL